MQKMPNFIIADTSCLIILSKIEGFYILKNLYGVVHITEEVKYEFKSTLPDWFEIHSINDYIRLQLIEFQVGKGEASSIALSFELPDSTVIIDDWKARKVAERLGVKITGILGVH